MDDRRRRMGWAEDRKPNADLTYHGGGEREVFMRMLRIPSSNSSFKLGFLEIGWKIGSFFRLTFRFRHFRLFFSTVNYREDIQHIAVGS